MWFFVDESWSPQEFLPCFGVLGGVLCEENLLPRMDNFLYGIRNKYFGKEHAKDSQLELRGKQLLSNHILKKWYSESVKRSYPKNISVVKEMLSFPVKEEVFLKVFSSIVYTSNNRAPGLICPAPKRLAEPFRMLISNVSRAASELSPDIKVKLVFDQRVAVQTQMSIAIKNFINGMDQVDNIFPYPLFGVSHAIPGLQFADVFTHLIAKRVQKDDRIMSLYKDLSQLQWQSKSKNKTKRFGFHRFDEISDRGRVNHVPRRKW